MKMPNIMGLQNMAHEMGRKVPRQMQGYGEKLKKFTKLMEKIELNCEAKERLTNHAICEIFQKKVVWYPHQNLQALRDLHATFLRVSIVRNFCANFHGSEVRRSAQNKEGWVEEGGTVFLLVVGVGDWYFESVINSTPRSSHVVVVDWLWVVTLGDQS